jgi:PPOX class probable F420-dependent enzyme
MDEQEARRRFSAARVAVLATADAAGTPHLVPVTFAVAGDTVWTAVDDKPKRNRRLRRHDNIRAQPRVSLLVQHWSEDWSRLWWVRADGLALVTTEPSTVDRVTGLLRQKYPQYQEIPVGGPVIEVAVHTWRGWPA